MQRLQDKVCLITGGAGSIGFAMAQRFQSEGAIVLLADVNADKLAERMGSVEGDGWHSFQTDVSQEAEVQRLFAEIEAQFGRLDVLVNNAANWKRDGPVTEISGDDWDYVQAATLKSVFLCSKQAVLLMRKQSRGSIINIATVNAVFGLALAAYTAAKGGVLALTRVMATMHGPEGIRVNAISPGTIRSESWNARLERNPQELDEWAARYPLQRVGTPEEVAALAAHLASDEAANTTGANFMMDGGLSVGLMLPSYGATTRDT